MRRRALRIHGPAGIQEFMYRVFGRRGAFSRALVSPTQPPLSIGACHERGGTPPRPWPDARVIGLNGAGMVGFPG